MQAGQARPMEATIVCYLLRVL